MRISIVCDSGYGHTAKQAQFIAEGAQRQDSAQVRLTALADGDLRTAAYLGQRVAELAARFSAVDLNPSQGR